MSEEFQMVRTQMEQMLTTMANELDIPVEELVERIEDFNNYLKEAVNTNEPNKKEVAVEIVDVKQEEPIKVSDAEGMESTEQSTVNNETGQTNKQSDNPLMDGEEGNHEMTEKMAAPKANETEFKVMSEGQDDTVFKDFHTQTIRTNMIATPEGNMIQETVKIVDLQNLVSELTEYIRLTSGNEFSKIEMQLNPANLGKMIVEVTSNHGEVTTKIIAQTQAGKEAIETNLAQMRTNLEQQGVRVASIEVTVESHAFEQNLQGEAGKEQEQLMKEQQQENKKHQMNLNLNELTLDDLAGLMSEEEMITVRVMRENGNKIDLTV
jgi:flagellar hook-length control protein FliK